jgi:hypothetical protein
MIAILDQRRPNKKGLFPIRIRIVHNRIYRDYGTKLTASVNDFKKILSDKPKGKMAEVKQQVVFLLERAFEIVESIDPFTFDEFNNVYLNKKNNDRNNIFFWYDDKIENLREEKQLGTLITYEYSKKSMEKFTGLNVLRFDKVTPKFLNKYERWIIASGGSPTTVGIYLRPLRHIFNLIIHLKEVRGTKISM